MFDSLIVVLKSFEIGFLIEQLPLISYARIGIGWVYFIDGILHTILCYTNVLLICRIHVMASRRQLNCSQFVLVQQRAAALSAKINKILHEEWYNFLALRYSKIFNFGRYKYDKPMNRTCSGNGDIY